MYRDPGALGLWDRRAFWQDRPADQPTVGCPKFIDANLLLGKVGARAIDDDGCGAQAGVGCLTDNVNGLKRLSRTVQGEITGLGDH